MNCFVFLLLLLQVAQSGPPPGLPSSPGVYFRQNEKNWIPLQKTVFSKTTTKGLELFLETGGYSNLGMTVVCPGAKASTRISTPKPAFYIREAGPSTDVMFIRLARHRDSRGFHKSYAAITVENKEGFIKQDIRKAMVTLDPDRTFTVTPELDLGPGEYLLVIDNAVNSYDFGIDKSE
jgi:hypothetical protein